MSGAVGGNFSMPTFTPTLRHYPEPPERPKAPSFLPPMPSFGLAPPPRRPQPTDAPKGAVEMFPRSLTTQPPIDIQLSTTDAGSGRAALIRQTQMTLGLPLTVPPLSKAQEIPHRPRRRGMRHYINVVQILYSDLPMLTLLPQASHTKCGLLQLIPMLLVSRLQLQDRIWLIHSILPCMGTPPRRLGPHVVPTAGIEQTAWQTGLNSRAMLAQYEASNALAASNSFFQQQAAQSEPSPYRNHQNTPAPHPVFTAPYQTPGYLQTSDWLNAGYGAPSRNDPLGDSDVGEILDNETASTTRSYVATELTAAIPAGVTCFSVVNQDKIKIGQTLNIGMPDSPTFEYVVVRGRGSVITEDETAYPHVAGEIVRLAGHAPTRLSRGRPISDVATSTKLPDGDSDVEELGDNSRVVHNRKLVLPSGPHDKTAIPMFHMTWIDRVQISNPSNFDKESKYFGKCWKWKWDDPRLLRKTPSDILPIEVIVNECFRIKTSKDPILAMRIERFRSTFFTTDNRNLPGRKTVAILYHSFAIHERLHNTLHENHFLQLTFW